MFKLLPFDTLCIIYKFEPTGAIFSFRDWMMHCRLNDTTKSNQYDIICQWMDMAIPSIRSPHTSSDLSFYGFVARKMINELVNRSKHGISIINMMLLMMAKRDADIHAHAIIRKTVSRWLFDNERCYGCNDAINMRMMANIQYYTEYDSPQHIVAQIERFDITKYVTATNPFGITYKTNIPDLEHCPWPIKATRGQIDAYYHFSMADESEPNDKKRTFLQSLYVGDMFEPYSSYYRPDIDWQCKGYKAHIIFHAYGYAILKAGGYKTLVGKFKDQNIKYYKVISKNAKNKPWHYMLIMMLTSKRREEFLDISDALSDKFTPIFNDFVNSDCELWYILLPNPHRDASLVIDCIDCENSAKNIPFKKLINCHLFTTYLKLYWKHEDIIRQNIKEPLDYNQFVDYENKDFYKHHFDISLQKDAQTTKIVHKHLFEQ